MAGTRTIAIPESVLLSAQSLDDLEDWLAAHNPAFLERMRRIRDDEDLAEQGKDLAEVLEAMAYRVIVLPTAEADLEAKDPSIRRRVLRRIVWLGENAAETLHHRMSNLPDNLAGLCRLRVGHYRILYWVYPQRELLKVYRVQHRREVYEDL